MNTDFDAEEGGRREQPGNASVGGRTGKVGNYATHFDLIQVAEEFVDRFPSAPPHDSPSVTKHDTAKWVSMLSFEPCAPRDEEALEDWADRAAARARALNPSVVVVRDAMAAQARPAVAGVVRRAPTESFEGLISSVATAVFTHSQVVERVEERLITGERQESVLASREWFLHLSARYLRLGRRREWQFCMSNDRLRVSVLRSVPVVVENDYWRLRRKETAPDLLTLYESLQDIEAGLLHQYGELPPPPQPIRAFPVAEVQTRQPLRNPTTGICFSCGAAGHYRKDCPSRGARCESCGLLGHTKVACQNSAGRDPSGRLRWRTTNRPSRIQTEVMQDATTGDRITTASGVLEEMKKKILQTAERARKRRMVGERSGQELSGANELESTALTGVAMPVEDPVAAADGAENEGSPDEETQMLELANALASCFPEDDE